jgi:ribokinase
LNPAPGQPLDLQRAGVADYLIPNETEAEALTGIAVRSVDDARRCAQRMLEGGARRAIITLGSQGALLAGAEGMEHIAPFKIDPLDTTGAGDAFIGSLAVFLASGFEEREAISRSNLYAALSTLAVGTQKSFVTMERFESEWVSRRKGAAF